MSDSTSTRRDFLKTSSLAVGGAVAGSLAMSRSAHAAGSDVLTIGLVGCGGRGTGAARDALAGDPNTKLTAVADVFPDNMTRSVTGLAKIESHAGRVDVPEERQFGGFDGYQKLIDSGVDVVLLATPPHFRPMQLKAAVEAGKHVFCEKPVAVDAPGIRSVLETAGKAREQKLTLVSGLCWRYHHGVRDIMQRVADGEIGEIRSIQNTYLTGTLWHRGRKDDDTEMKYQMRNWLYFTWLSGDHNCEQHVHSLDKAVWAMGDTPPVRAWGIGSRQVRTEQPTWGNIYDNFGIVYEYPNDVRVHAYCRQQRGCWGNVTDNIIGTKGHANVLGFRTNGLNGENEYKFSGEGGNMYRLEHEAMFKSIRDGEARNNGTYMSYSSMLAVMGRMVAYTGRNLTWEEALASEEVLAPTEYSFDADPPIMPDENGQYPVAVPGVTKFR